MKRGGGGGGGLIGQRARLSALPRLCLKSRNVGTMSYHRRCVWSRRGMGVRSRSLGSRGWEDRRLGFSAGLSLIISRFSFQTSFPAIASFSPYPETIAHFLKFTSSFIKLLMTKTSIIERT